MLFTRLVTQEDDKNSQIGALSTTWLVMIKRILKQMIRNKLIRKTKYLWVDNGVKKAHLI